MESRVDVAIRRSLGPSEHVLWTEVRRRTRRTVVGRLVGVALLLAWDMVGVLVLWREITAEGAFVEKLFSRAERSTLEIVTSGPTHPTLEFVGLMLFGFVLTVMVAVVDPRRDRNRAYVVTDQRVLTFGGFWRPEIERSIPMEELGTDRVVLGRDGSGRETITFWDHAWTDDDGTHAPSWELLADAPMVHDLIRRAIGRAGPSLPSTGAG